MKAFRISDCIADTIGKLVVKFTDFLLLISIDYMELGKLILKILEQVVFVKTDQPSQASLLFTSHRTSHSFTRQKRKKKTVNKKKDSRTEKITSFVNQVCEEHRQRTLTHSKWELLLHLSLLKLDQDTHLVVDVLIGVLVV